VTSAAPAADRPVTTRRGAGRSGGSERSGAEEQGRAAIPQGVGGPGDEGGNPPDPPAARQRRSPAQRRFPAVTRLRLARWLVRPGRRVAQALVGLAQVVAAAVQSALDALLTLLQPASFLLVLDGGDGDRLPFLIGADGNFGPCPKLLGSSCGTAVDLGAAYPSPARRAAGTLGRWNG
jgi:hypothetical protein